MRTLYLQEWQLTEMSIFHHITRECLHETRTQNLREIKVEMVKNGGRGPSPCLPNEVSAEHPANVLALPKQASAAESTPTNPRVRLA